MKLQALFTSIALLSWNLVWAISINPTNNVELQHRGIDNDVEVFPTRSLNLAPEKTELVARADCSEVNNVGQIIESIGTSSELAAYVTFGGVTTHFICTKLGGGGDCIQISAIIGSGIASLYYIVGRVTGAKTGDKRDSNSPASPTMLEYMGSVFNESLGFNYDSITDQTPTLPALPAGERAPLEYTHIRGLKIPGFNHSLDFNHVDFGNGEGHIMIPEEYITQHSGNATLDKRTTRYGFKISYTTRMASQLTQSHIASMGSTFGYYWADFANHDQSMANMMGLVKTGHSANFYWRIIPETVDFGLNYESVDICGGMAKFL